MDSIEKLKEIFAKFPTVGPRTAGRFVYYLIKQPKEKINELIGAIQELSSKIKLCKLCFQPFEANRDTIPVSLCAICSDSKRDKNLLCIVEKEADLLSIEITKKYNGLYFILGGVVGTMRKEEIMGLRIEELKNRIKNNNFSEIIVALNSTQEGRATSILIENSIKEIIPPASPKPNSEGGSPTFRITHLAKGLPVGGELEYADEETLESALLGRK